jgi:hypothetical protein
MWQYFQLSAISYVECTGRFIFIYLFFSDFYEALIMFLQDNKKDKKVE